MSEEFDIVIIGAGVVGCAIARELSKYNLKVAVLEKESDAGMGTSGRNSGVVHAGFNCATGTLKAALCVKGCRRFEKYCRELGVPYKRTGKLVVAFDDEDLTRLRKLKDTGERNGVEGLRIVNKDEMNRLQPNIGGIAAMYSPWTAVTSPCSLTIALAENAVANGVRFFLGTKVESIGKSSGRFVIRAGSRQFEAGYVINSAGLFSDKIAMMAGINGYRIYPCRGEYFILDKRAGSMLNMPVYPVPRPDVGGLGVHLTTTIDGNILIGPSAEYIDRREDFSTTQEVLDQLYKEAKALLPMIDRKDFIRDYSGVRPKLTDRSVGGFSDFVIEESKQVENFINLIGIESPGLTSAPEIAEMVAGIIGRKEELKENKSFNPVREAPVRFSELSDAEKARLISQDPDYGEIICRCEGITLKEIKNAMDNPLGVKTVAGIKYRTRATMGRCQGGYCMTRIVRLLQEKYKCEPEDIMYTGEGSGMFTGRVK